MDAQTMANVPPAEGDLRRLQLAELGILEAIDELCRAEGIVYFIDGGTLLGALRHGGFIPWDDDIDIGMPRADYDRFLEAAATGLRAGYSLHTYENTPGFAGMFAKVYRDGTAFETAETREAGCPQGIFVDVFPYDALPTDPDLRARQLKRAGLWQRVSYLYHAGQVTVPLSGAAGAIARAACRVAHVVIRIAFTREGIHRRFLDATAPATEPADDFSTFAYPEYGPFPRDVVLPTATCSFEGRTFACPHDARRFLDIGYNGTWQELPPESERRTHKPLRLDFGD